MGLAELKRAQSDRQKVELWLTKIGEHDEACRAEVIEQCAKDREARAYYVGRYSECTPTS